MAAVKHVFCWTSLWRSSTPLHHTGAPYTPLKQHVPGIQKPAVAIQFTRRVAHRLQGTARSLRKRWRSVSRRLREAGIFARAMVSARHPIVAQIVPIRRCNLACAYCNEFDAVSAPVPLAEMLRRVDHLVAFSTTIITISGGEPMLHPGLDEIIYHIRRRGAIATLITTGYLLTADRIRRLNHAGLDYLQISIDNVVPDDISKKSLKVLDPQAPAARRARRIRCHRQLCARQSRAQPSRRARDRRPGRSLGLNSTVGILHDGEGQLRPLAPDQMAIYRGLLEPDQKMLSFAQYDRVQRNISQGLPNNWHCRAGGRFLYVCEDGLVHYCSQQRGRPAIPLEKYTRNDLVREAAREKNPALRIARSPAFIRPPCSTDSASIRARSCSK